MALSSSETMASGREIAVYSILNLLTKLDSKLVVFGNDHSYTWIRFELSIFTKSSKHSSTTVHKVDKGEFLLLSIATYASIGSFYTLLDP